MSENKVDDAIAQSFMRMAMADSRVHEIIDGYPNGRLILSAVYNRIRTADSIAGYPNSEQARRELLQALGYHRLVD